MDLLVRGAVDLSQTQSEKNSPLFGKKKKGGRGGELLSQQRRMVCPQRRFPERIKAQFLVLPLT